MSFCHFIIPLINNADPAVIHQFEFDGETIKIYYDEDSNYYPYYYVDESGKKYTSYHTKNSSDGAQRLFVDIFSTYDIKSDGVILKPYHTYSLNNINISVYSFNTASNVFMRYKTNTKDYTAVLRNITSTKQNDNVDIDFLTEKNWLKNGKNVHLMKSQEKMANKSYRFPTHGKNLFL